MLGVKGDEVVGLHTASKSCRQEANEEDEETAHRND